MKTLRIKAIENNVIYDDIYESIDEIHSGKSYKNKLRKKSKNETAF